MKTLKITAVSGGLSVPSSTRMLTDGLIEATRQAAEQAGVAVEFTVVELREITLDVAKVMVTGMPETRVEDALDALESADGVIAVTPVYAGSYAGIFKSFMDLVGTERLAGTPVLLGATGGSARHSMALEFAMRPLFTAVRAHSIPTGVYAATEDFGAAWGNGSAGSAFASRVTRAGAELVNTILGGSLPARHLWEPPVKEGAQTQSTTAQAAGAISNEQARESVGDPGRGSTAALLKSDGTKGRLRPDMEDFVPMTDLFGKR